MLLTPYSCLVIEEAGELFRLDEVPEQEPSEGQHGKVEHILGENLAVAHVIPEIHLRNVRDYVYWAVYTQQEPERGTE